MKKKLSKIFQPVSRVLNDIFLDHDSRTKVACIVSITILCVLLFELLVLRPDTRPQSRPVAPDSIVVVARGAHTRVRLSTSQNLSYEHEHAVDPQSIRPPSDTIVFYSYFTSPERRANAQFFIDHGYAPNTDFIFIDSGGSANFSLLNLNVTEKPWWSIYRRRNYGYDFCAWLDVLQHVKQSDPERFRKYKYFVFMNASVRGPFIPTWMMSSSKKTGTPTWKEIFVNQLNNETKLTGTTINCRALDPEDLLNQLHVQSMFLVTDRMGLDVFLEYTECFQDKTEVIIRFEIGLTQAFLKRDYNIACQQVYWMDHDFRYRNRESTVEKCLNAAKVPGNVHGDQNFVNGYFGTTLHPLETIFFKYQDWRFEDGLDISELYTQWINQHSEEAPHKQA